MLKVYSNAGMSKRHIGTCENGKVYREEAFGRTEIGSYENGNVYSGVGYMKTRVGGYDNHTIYKNGFFDDSIGEVDSSGNAYDGTGSFKNTIGTNVRDVGAAAAAQLLFPGCYYEGDSSDEQSVLGAIVSFVLALLWKFIRTLPFWGAYYFGMGLINMSFITNMPGRSANNPSSSTSFILFLFLSFAAYLILHTILLVRRKRLDVQYKYWPFHVGFFLYLSAMNRAIESLGTLFSTVAPILACIAIVVTIINILKSPEHRGKVMQWAIFVGALAALPCIFKPLAVRFGAAFAALFLLVIVFRIKPAPIPKGHDFCPNCGTKYSPGNDHFCGKCGQKLP